jgi:hypothetical protein
MTTTRGPVPLSSRSRYRAATSDSVAATSAGSLGVSSASASQPENEASRAIAAIAPPNRRTVAGSTSSVNSSRRVRLPESTPCSSAMVCANRRAYR